MDFPCVGRKLQSQHKDIDKVLGLVAAVPVNAADLLTCGTYRRGIELDEVAHSLYLRLEHPCIFHHTAQLTPVDMHHLLNVLASRVFALPVT